MPSYDWIPFYEEFAKKLLNYKNNRSELIKIVRKVFDDIDLDLPTLETDNKMTDIDPFTVLGLFNKGLTKNNRKKIINSFTKYIDIESPVPTSFRSIPILMSLNATFYDFEHKRGEDDIDNLWELFEAALDYSEKETEENKDKLSKYYNLVIKQRQIGNAKISMGLYWIAPHTFLNLDGTNVEYIYKSEKLPEELVNSLPKMTTKMNVEKYFEITEKVEDYILDEKSSVENLPEFSYEAWEYSKKNKKTARDDLGKGLPDSGVRMVHYWLYSPGKGSNRWDEFYEKDIMAIRWSELGDLTQYRSRDEIIEQFRELHQSSASFKNKALATWEFANEMKIGDVIFVKKGRDKLIGRGIVESDYYYDDSVESEYKNIRNVRWTHNGEWEYPGTAIGKTLTDTTVSTTDTEKLKAVFRDESEEEYLDELEEVTYDSYIREDFLSEVFMNEEQYDNLVALLKNKKNIILQGPPGVGKTYMAKRLAYSMIGERNIERVKMVQFHQSYSYEDFIEGFRPAQEGEGFEIKKGAFHDFCREAEKDIENDYFFIIDEINRGNLSKIFGELLMLIENDKRGHQLQLLYSDDKFSVPSNVYIIGMMNTADRSLAILDYALRRRFAFYDLQPAFQSTGFSNYQEALANKSFDALVQTIASLNLEIENDESLGAGFAIGHSYLSNIKEITGNELDNIIEYEIIPLISEYWFDELNKVNEWKNKLRRAIR